jgi:hypothetical protein
MLMFHQISIYKCAKYKIFNYGEVIYYHSLLENKFPSVPINSFGVYLQQENCDYTIFSSWIGAFVSSVANERQAEGTIEEHIKAAMSVGGITD